MTRWTPEALAQFRQRVPIVGTANAQDSPTKQDYVDVEYFGPIEEILEIERRLAQPDPYRLIRRCRQQRLPLPVAEYAFAAPARKWRADYAWPERLIIVEVDGAAWVQGRHTRGAGFIADQRKLNFAAKLGYRVLRYTPDRLDECIADLRVVFR